MTEAIWIAIISAISGGGAFKIFDLFLNKRKTEFDEGVQFRREYKDKIDELEEDVIMLKTELRDSKRRESEWKAHSEKLFFDFRQYQLDVYELILNKEIQVEMQSLKIDKSKFVKEITFPMVD